MPSYVIEIYGYKDTQAGHFNVGLIKLNDDFSIAEKTVIGLNIPSGQSNIKNNIQSNGVLDGVIQLENAMVTPEDPGYRPEHVSYGRTISQAQYDAATSFVGPKLNSLVDYNLFTNSCFNFVQDVWNAAGQTGLFLTSFPVDGLQGYGLPFGNSGEAGAQGVPYAVAASVFYDFKWQQVVDAGSGCEIE